MAPCTFFGHRDCMPHIFEELKEAIRSVIVRRDVTTFYVGNHGNYDRYVRGALCELKKEYPAIAWYIVLAYLPKSVGQSEEYENSIYPEGIETVPPRFAINYRNQWMLNHSEYVITYITRTSGGASKFAALAARQGKVCIKLGEHAK